MHILRAGAASPFARKVRIAAALLELDDRIEVVAADTSDPDNSLRMQNPLGKIPTLILENGDVLYDSPVIIEYLDWLAGGGRIIPSDPAQRFRSLTRQALADGIADASVLMRYEVVWRDPDKRSERWLAHQGDKISRALNAFEASPPEELSDVGTIALASALGYLDLRFEGAWRAGHRSLARWLDLFSAATPSFEATRFQG